jgi:hypothetical protein
MRSALRAGRLLPSGRFLVLISVRGWVDPRAKVWLEELGQLKNRMTSPGREPATFRLVASQCLKQLRYRVPQHTQHEFLNQFSNAIIVSLNGLPGNKYGTISCIMQVQLVLRFVPAPLQSRLSRTSSQLEELYDPLLKSGLRRIEMLVKPMNEFTALTRYMKDILTQFAGDAGNVLPCFACTPKTFVKCL